MLISLGSKPHDLIVPLARDSDFVRAVVIDDPWPVGTGIELRFFTRTADPDDPPTAVWEATISGNRAEWNEPASAVRTVLNAGATYVRLVYVDGSGARLLWARGRVDDD